MEAHISTAFFKPILMEKINHTKSTFNYLETILTKLYYYNFSDFPSK